MNCNRFTLFFNTLNNTMKAMILAAGRGVRLKPLTDKLPKPLVRVGGETLIERHIKNIVAAGFESIVINTAHLGEKIHDHVGEGARFDIPIVFSDEGEEALETGGGIANALPLLGSEPFLVVNADIYCDIPFDAQFRLSNALVHLIMVNNPEHHPNGDFDAIELNLPGQQRYTYSGVGYYHPKLFKHEQRVFPLVDILRQSVVDKTINAEVYTGAWFDIGTGGRLHEANKYALKNK